MSRSVPGPAEAGADLVHELLDRQPHGGGGFQDLVAVLVGAGLEAHLLPQEAVEAGQGIGHHRGVGVADVGLGVDVIDGRGEVDGHDSEQQAVSSELVGSEQEVVRIKLRLLSAHRSLLTAHLFIRLQGLNPFQRLLEQVRVGVGVAGV